ncbi:MAG TPA: histidinol-phosphate transaminase [Chitinophagaceae bacterium]|nr:histidinol-phosphate transaminase [Chitinophagaceae bacterium]
MNSPTSQTESFDLDRILRENIRQLVPYSSARDEFQGNAKVFLDANENSFGSPLPSNYNRYPDPGQALLKEKICQIKGVPVERIFLGNGSDECIDLLIRACCNPGVDNILVCPPTYGMYEVCAHINDIGVRKACLDSAFQLDLAAIGRALNDHTKIIFLCSPNNPTGNSLSRHEVEIILGSFPGLVVVDEAYINFARQKSFIQELKEYPNLVVLQTLSKAWGLAALRIGMAFASPALTGILSKIKPPYNIGQASQELALQALDQISLVNERTRMIVQEREQLKMALEEIPSVLKIFPSEANFLLVRVTNPKGIYRFLVGLGIIVRDRSRVELCEGCLRITVGTPEENRILLEGLKKFQE